MLYVEKLFGSRLNFLSILNQTALNVIKHKTINNDIAMHIPNPLGIILLINAVIFLMSAVSGSIIADTT